MLAPTARAFFRQTKPVLKPSSQYSQENFANGSSSIYFDQMYEQWRKDPESVHASFRAYFENVDSGAASAYQAPPTLGQTGQSDVVAQVLAALGSTGAGASSTQDIHESLQIMNMIRAYQINGHEAAYLDPLELD